MNQQPLTEKTIQSVSTYFFAKRIFSLFFIWVITGITFLVTSQILDPNIWVTNGSVNAIATDGEYTYIGGYFTQVGNKTTGSGAKVTSTSHSLNDNFPIVNDIIEVAVPDGSGGWYIGGNFTKVGDFERNRIAHINADGTVNANWNPDANNTVSSIAISGSDIYVGGFFSTIGGQARNRLAKLNNTTGNADENWNPNAVYNYPFDGYIKAIAISGGDIYVGGKFFSIGGQYRAYIAKLNNTNGNADANWNANANHATQQGVVNSIVIVGSYIYVGGDFNSIGGLTRNRIAKLNLANASADATWNPNASSDVTTIAISGNDIYVGGWFNSIGGQTRNYIAKLNNTNGAANTTWNPNANYYIKAIAISGSDIYATGQFTSIGGQTRNFIAKLNNTSGNANTTWNPNASGPVSTIALSGNDIYFGGSFSFIGGQTRNNLAKLNADGTINANWNPNPNNSVSAIALSGSDIYVGGQFTTIGGQTRNRIAKLNNTSGNADVTWNPNSNNMVNAIALSGSDIYVGGQFTTIGGQTRNRIAKLNNTNGNVDASWNPNASNTINAITISGSDIYVGGFFTTIGGQTRNRIAKLNNTNGNADISWNPDASSTVYSIAISGSDIYVGGLFTTIGGQTRNRIAKLNNTNGNADVSWNPNSNNIVRTIAFSGNDIYIGGQFTTIGGQTRDRIAKLNNTNGSADESWDPSTNNSVNTLVIGGSNMYVGGAFTVIGGSPQSSFAKFTITKKIVFDANGGVGTMAPQELIFEQSTNLLVNTFTKTGYSFVGWNTAADGSGTTYADNASFTMNTDGITLYAQWSEKTYNVTYNAEGTSHTNPNTFTLSNLPVTLTAASKSGYTFMGWYDNTEFTGEAITEIATIEDKELWAKFEVKVYNITYHLDGGINHSDNPATFTIEDLNFVLGSASKDGYTFMGWYDNAEFTGEAITGIATIEDKELWAKFEVKVYNITYHLDGGINHSDNPATFTIEDLNFVLGSASKDGYTFMGWYDNAEFTGEAITGIATIEDKELWAKFSVITYNITYNADGGTHSNPETFTINNLPLALTTASKSGYTFEGWYDNAGFSGSAITELATIGDKTLWAKFSVITYNIAYNADGGTHSNPETFTINNLPLALTTASKSGYTFEGWYDNAGLSGSSITELATIGDKTLWAKFSVITYNIIYNADGGTHSNPAMFTINNLPLALAAASKSGYTFEGWYDNALLTGEPISEITLIGNLELWANFKLSTGVREIAKDFGKIFPNPTSGILYIELNNDIIKLVISDMSGKQLLVKTNLPKNTSIDLAGLFSGVYLITIQTDKEIFTRKIVKE